MKPYQKPEIHKAWEMAGGIKVVVLENATRYAPGGSYMCPQWMIDPTLDPPGWWTNWKESQEERIKELAKQCCLIENT